MTQLTRFIDVFSANIQTRREIDVETKILIHNLLDETMKQIKKTNVKDKTLNKNMKKNEKQRHFKFDGEKFKGTNGKFLRVAINNTTKAVRRVKPMNWTTEAKLKFYEKFPNLIDTEKPKKKKQKTKKTKNKETKNKEIKKEIKKEKKKTKISTIDLIATLVEQAKIGSLEEKTKEIKTKEIKTKEIKKQVKSQIQFKTNSQKIKKKKVTKNKKKIEKGNPQEINVKEFNHDELKETQYIDEQNNIWNDMHKQIGYYDDDNDVITLLS